MLHVFPARVAVCYVQCNVNGTVATWMPLIWFVGVIGEVASDCVLLTRQYIICTVQQHVNLEQVVP